MELNRRTVGTGLALIGATLLGISQCNDKNAPKPELLEQTAGDGDNHEVEKVRKIMSALLEDTDDEGPTVDMSPYLDEDGAIKSGFNPALATRACIIKNSDNFATTNNVGTSLIFPERIRTESEGVYPIRVIPNGNNAFQERINGTVYMDIVSGDGTEPYVFNVHDVSKTTQMVKKSVLRRSITFRRKSYSGRFLRRHSISR